jgi:hypothetical protein
VAVESLGHGSAGNGADDDGQECTEFDNALPQDRLFSGKSSRSRPYFVGPNRAAWLATSASAARQSGREWVASPAVATSMEPSSIIFVQIVTPRLLKRSASQPPGMLSSRNGTEKMKVTAERNVSRS